MEVVLNEKDNDIFTIYIEKIESNADDWYSFCIYKESKDLDNALVRIEFCAESASVSGSECSFDMDPSKSFNMIFSPEIDDDTWNFIYYIFITRRSFELKGIYERIVSSHTECIRITNASILK